MSARQLSRRNNIRGTDVLRHCDNALTPAEWIHLTVICQRVASNKSPILNVDGDLVAKTEVSLPVDSIDSDPASKRQRLIAQRADLDDLRPYKRIIIETEIGALATLAAI